MKPRALFFLFLALMLIQSSAGPYLLAADLGSYDMLIVGPEGYETSVGRFIDFKTGQGIKARFFSIEFINKNQSEPSTVRRLHDFVASERERAGIRYLLLVGTYDQVPTKYVYSPSYEYGLADYNYKPSDWYYAVPDWNDSEVGMLGGNLPEIAVGRLPVKDGEELERTLSKIIDVETNLEPGPLLVLGDMDVAQDSALSAPHLYYSSSVNLTSQLLIRLLSNEATHVISYSHGTTSALWTSDSDGQWRILMSCEQVSELNRTYGIQYMIACFTGALDLGNESLARVLITSAKGPALVIASSRVEISGNLISSRFWEEFLSTGDVGSSMVEALRSYLLDRTLFSSEYSFQYYSSYLDKVVYGDISWKAGTSMKNSVVSSVIPAESAASSPSNEILGATGPAVPPIELLALLSAAGTLSGGVLVVGVRRRHAFDAATKARATRGGRRQDRTP